MRPPRTTHNSIQTRNRIDRLREGLPGKPVGLNAKAKQRSYIETLVLSMSKQRGNIMVSCSDCSIYRRHSKATADKLNDGITLLKKIWK